MLRVTVPAVELFNEETEEFITIRETNLQLEHSLVSLKKWESKWHKPFLKDEPKKTDEEIRDYIRCMTITQNVNPDVFKYMPQPVIKEISEYIENPMTATWFSKDSGGRGAARSCKETITAEIIYYWMITLNIPVKFETWHLNQLLTLIKVVNIKNNPDSKKMSNSELARQRAALNAARKAKLHSKG